MIELLLCRSQLKRHGEDFAGLQSVHDAVKSQLEQQVADLTGKLNKVRTQVGNVWGHDNNIFHEAGAVHVPMRYPVCFGRESAERGHGQI